MRKWILIITTLIMAFLTASAFSESFFGGANAPPGPPQVHPNPVIAPSDFGGLVTSLDQQTKTSLSQEYKQQLSKQPSSVTPSNSDQSIAKTPMPAPPVRQSDNITAQPLPATTTPPTNAAPSPVSTQPTNAASTPQQGYTGFAPGNQTNTGTSTGDNSGGWNIKY